MPYTWEDVRLFLEKKLRKTKSIQHFGTIGSYNLLNDIDTIVTKKPNAKPSEFYKEVHNIFDTLNNFMKKKYNRKLIKFSRRDHQDEILKLANYKTGDLVLQVLIYFSWPQIEMHWHPNLIRDLSIKEIAKGYRFIIGNYEQLFSKEFSFSRKYDALFLYLNDLDRINSNFESKFLIKTMNHSFSYIIKLSKLNIGLKAKTAKELRNNFYKLADLIYGLN